MRDNDQAKGGHTTSHDLGWRCGGGDGLPDRVAVIGLTCVGAQSVAVTAMVSCMMWRRDRGAKWVQYRVVKCRGVNQMMEGLLMMFPWSIRDREGSPGRCVARRRCCEI